MKAEPSLRTLDLCGLRCPLPVLRTRKALRAMAPGDRLLVTCTDPLAGIDIPHACRESGDVVEAQTEAAGVLTFRVRRGRTHDAAPASTAP